MREWLQGVDLSTAARRGAIVGAALLAVLAVVAALTLGGRGPAERLAVQGRSVTATTEAAPAEPPDTTLPLVPLTTGVPVPDATQPPPPTTAPSATPGPPRPGSAPLVSGAGGGTAPGAVLGPDGSVLRPPAHATEPRKIDRAKGCHSAADRGWDVRDCGALRAHEGVLLWVIQSKGETTKVLLLREARPEQWSVVLSATDAGGRQFAAIRAFGADVTGDGQPELAFGFRRRGPDRVLSLDVVDGRGSTTLHRDLPGGAVRMDGGHLATWAAAGDGRYHHDTLRHDGAQWRVATTAVVDRTAVPPSTV